MLAVGEENGGSGSDQKEERLIKQPDKEREK